MEGVTIAAAGDAALRVEWKPAIDPGVSRRAVSLSARVRRACGPLVRDVVVGYCSVTVYFDPVRVDSDALASQLERLARESSEGQSDRERLIEVAVCYGAEFGPDLADVAAFARVTEEDVVALHTAPTYRVYVVGFLPGFAYMATLDPRLALPRRSTPRTRVPAGSVAIAGGQTGIYPADTPGGWHLIGRTRVKPYDASRSEPFLFEPGDRVRFHAIDRNEFERTA